MCTPVVMLKGPHTNIFHYTEVNILPRGHIQRIYIILQLIYTPRVTLKYALLCHSTINILLRGHVQTLQYRTFTH